MFNPGDKIKAIRDIHTKRRGIDFIPKGTIGLVHFCDPFRREVAAIFEGHSMAYEISIEDIKHA